MKPNKKPTYEDLEKLIIELKSDIRLKQIQDRFKMLLKASEDMITIHKPNGQYVYYNGPTCYAIRPKDIIGKMPSDLFDKSTSKSLMTAFEKVEKTGESETIEVYLDWLGQKKWFSEYIFPVKNTAGEVVEIVKVCKDIHTRKLAEQELNIANKKLAFQNEEKGKRTDELTIANEELHLLSTELLEKNRVVSEIKNKFENLFNKSPVSIWEQDFSEALALLNKKKAEVGDIKTYLDENPEFVKKCVSKIKILNVNNITLELIGVKDLKELISHIRKTNSEKSYNEIKNELISFALGKNHYMGETEFVRKNGTILFTIVKSTMIDDAGKNIASIVDITKRRQAEEALKASEENYRELVEQIPDGVYKSTHAGKFLEANPAMIKMLGYNSKEELLAIDIKSDFYIDETERDNLVLNEINQELGVFQARKKDGSLFWAEDHGWYTFNESGKIMHHQGIMRDITVGVQKDQELININKQLASQNEFNTSLLNAIPFAMDIVDEEGNVLFMSENFKKNFGHDIIGQKNWSQYKDGNLQHPKYGVLLGESTKTQVEGLLSGKTIEISHTGMMFQGKKAILEIFNDITELKSFQEKQVILLKKAKESDRLKSAFLANMSHEIRTPMNGILGFSDLLKTPNLSGKEQQQYINIIEKSGKRMLNILNDIVNVSKIESGLMELNIEETNINEQIDFIYSFFKPEVEEKGIRLVIKKPLIGKEPFIQSDREKIYGILTNLIKNAVKFTKNGTIELGYVLKTINEPAELEFYIKDTGIGVPKDRLVAIFDRFIQADISGKMAYQGAGLGLSISKAYVELLGGKIWVESEEGKGSIFYFTLPYLTELKEKNEPKNES